MNEKHKNWLKKIGVAGFLFFLIKGILWLVLGTAFYKWLKDLFIISTTILLPVFAEAQTTSEIKPVKKEFQTPQYPHYQKPSFQLYQPERKPFFCRLEDKMNVSKKSQFRFRLGSFDYTNKLEYSDVLMIPEIETSKKP